MRCKGIVKGNVVVLDEGIYLLDGVHVTVTAEQEQQRELTEITDAELAQRRALGKRLQAFGQRITGRHVNLGDLVIEGRKELEDRA